MRIVFFKIASIILLFNAFLVSSKLPDGLFSSKEVGLYFSVGLCCLLAVLACFQKKNISMKLTVVDLLVVAYLILIPFFHLLFFKFVNISALVVQGAYGLSYFSLRILTSDLKVSSH